MKEPTKPRPIVRWPEDHVFDQPCRCRRCEFAYEMTRAEFGQKRRR